MTSAEEARWIATRRPGKAFHAFLIIFILLCLAIMVAIVV